MTGVFDWCVWLICLTAVLTVDQHVHGNIVMHTRVWQHCVCTCNTAPPYTTQHPHVVITGGVYARLVQRQLLGGSHRGSEVCVDGAASTADVHEQV